MIDKIKVEDMLKAAKNNKNIFLFENLSESRPNIGAMKINTILATEFEKPK